MQDILLKESVLPFTSVLSQSTHKQSVDGTLSTTSLEARGLRSFPSLDLDTGIATYFWQLLQYWSKND